MKYKIVYCIALLALLTSIGMADSTLNGAKNGRKPFPAGSPPPEMSDRKPELVPQPIPPGILYVYAPNSVVNQVATRLATALESEDASICGSTLFLQPGVWKLFKGKYEIGKKNFSTMGMVDPQSLKKDGVKGALESVFLKDSNEIKIAFVAVAQLLKSDGGYEIRAFTANEMKRWWAGIAFNLEEPLFIVASKGGNYKFVLGFVDDSSVYVLDELKTLSKKPNKVLEPTPVSFTPAADAPAAPATGAAQR